MWLFTTYGFFSATCARENSGKGALDTNLIQVRARMRQHLENLCLRFPKELGALSILETPHNDYRYRLIVKKDCWTTIAAELSQEIDYGNFKNKCHDREKELSSEYVSALHQIWGVGYGLQSKGPVAEIRAHEVELSTPPQPQTESGTSHSRLCDCLAKTTTPPIGTPSEYFRNPDPLRLLVLQEICATGGNKYDVLDKSCSELNAETILELGVDVALFQLLEQRTAISQFTAIRRALFKVRKFAQHRSTAEEMIDEAKIIHGIKPGDPDDCAERFHAYRSIYRAISNATVVAGFLLGKPTLYLEFEAAIPKPYDIEFVCDSEGDSTVAMRMRRRVRQMGRRNFNPAINQLVGERVRIFALQVAYTDAHQSPVELASAVTTNALEYMKNKQISLAMRVDGVGQFALALGSTVKRIGTANTRTIEGYGFTDDGEAVYIVRRHENQTLDHKRSWKAATDYGDESVTEYDQICGTVVRPDGPVKWGNLR